MTGDRADRELLFEALAVHLGFVSRHALDDLEKVRREGAAAIAERPWAACWSRHPCWTRSSPPSWRC